MTRACARPSKTGAPVVTLSGKARRPSRKPKIRIIETDEALTEALAALCRLDPVMARIIGEGAKPTLRKREPGFQGLVQIVMGQQLSVASADAIWRRLAERLGSLAPETVRTCTDAELKACGLSAPKIRTLRAISDAVLNGALPLETLGGMAADQAHATLTAVKGIGPWTADIYLMFCLRHSDAFAAGDLALQEAARLAYGLDARPSPMELTSLAEHWRPWRAIAAIVLWAHYKIAKRRGGLSENTNHLTGTRTLPSGKSKDARTRR